MLVLDIFEARDPKKTYTFKEIKGKVEQIILKLEGSLLELKGLPMKAYLDTGLNIVYNNGKRYGKLEEAIKTLAIM